MAGVFRGGGPRDLTNTVYRSGILKSNRFSEENQATPPVSSRRNDPAAPLSEAKKGRALAPAGLQTLDAAVAQTKPRRRTELRGTAPPIQSISYRASGHTRCTRNRGVPRTGAPQRGDHPAVVTMEGQRPVIVTTAKVRRLTVSEVPGWLWCASAHRGRGGAGESVAE